MLENLMAVVIFAVVTSFSPGPNNALAMSIGANFGAVRSWRLAVGTQIGFTVMVVVSGLGLAQLLLLAPMAEQVMQAVAGGFVLYLGYRIATSKPAALKSRREVGRPLGIFGAASFQLVNPKAWAICLGALGAFADFGGPGQNIAVILAVFVVTTASSIFTWASGGAAISRRLSTPTRQRRFNYAMAVLMVLSALLALW
jgi:threonine/homoserine/homoserine lactone efflux protein